MIQNLTMDSKVKTLEYLSVITFLPLNDLQQKLEKISSVIREITGIPFISPANYFPLPIGIEVPNEIPRMSMETHDGLIRLQISGNQVQFIANNEKISCLENFMDLIYKISENLIKEFSFKIIRIGAVSRNYKIISEPAKYISDNYLSSTIDKDYIECNIRLVERQTIDFLKLNHVFQLESGSINIQETTYQKNNEPVLLITIDINSDQFNSLPLDLTILEKFATYSKIYLESNYIDNELA
ncbi:hypothetical protein BK820_10300 [Acinetobacter sp. LCT-H3]|nr:hypothetical protein BK820_10300 [Acinetobacter sp. LCT-H3]